MSGILSKCGRLGFQGFRLVPWFLVALLPARAEDTAGIPWTGAPGITETVGAIMARDKQANPNTHSQARELKKRALRNFNARAQSPFSPLTDTPAPVLEPASPQAPGISFLAVRVSEAGFIPPDSMGDIGPSQIVVCVNGRLKVFDRAGNLGPLDTTPENFFSSVTSAGITDPRVRYDRLSARWFILAIDVPNSKKNNNVVIAVSDGPTITGTSSFTFFAFKPSALPPSNNGTFADYPTLGVDNQALYIGANIFSAFYLGTEGYVVNKADLLAGTLTATAFRSLATGTGNGPFTPQGVDNDDAAATEGYFLGTDNITHGLLVLRRISNPGGTPSISSNINITVPATENPMGGVVAKGVATALDDLDDRLFAARMHHGRLWTAHNIEVNASGAASTAGNRDGARWYELANLTGTPVVVQSGTLYDPAASTPTNYFIPSCAVSGQGHMALACSAASANEFAEIVAAGRFATDTLGTIRAPTVVQTSTTPYDVGSQNPRRWGDYSIVSVDPNDDMTFWTVQEYCNATNSWGVRVIQLLAPPPARPAACNPATLTQGVVNATVTLTGTVTNGSGFFDPGAGYPNHITASVAGGSITVNSVTYNNPTNLTLNLTVAANATPSARTVTVTNPDGQSLASLTGILTIAAPATNSLPVITAASITPALPSTTNNLLATVTGASDADSDPITFAYQWQENATNLVDQTTSNLLAVVTFAGGSYRCVITPNDGHGNGNPFPTAAVLVPVDFDSNAINDDWEVAYFGHFGVDANTDADGDGQSNQQEFLAGTTPTNAVSVLRVSSVGVTGNDVQVDFVSAANKLYRLEASLSPDGSSPTIISNNIPGTGGIIQILDVGAVAQPQRFYRVWLLP